MTMHMPGEAIEEALPCDDAALTVSAPLRRARSAPLLAPPVPPPCSPLLFAYPLDH